MLTENLNTHVETTEPEGAILSQKDAVYTYALEALAGATPADGQSLGSLITKDVRKAIRVRLYAGMKDGSVKLSKSVPDSKLKKYCSSLINNWLKKDSRFN